MQSKISVLQVIPQLDVSGASQGCADIAEALIRNSYLSYIATASGVKIDQVKKQGTKVIILPVNSKNPITIIFNIFRLSKIIRDNKINIVHVRSRAPAWSSYLACKITNVKFISTFHGTYNFNNFLKKFYNSIMLRTDGTIAISKFINNHIHQNYSTKPLRLKTIARGIDINFFNPKLISQSEIHKALDELNLKKESIKILLPGRLTRWKGHSILIKAIANLLKSHQFDIQVLFFGPEDNQKLKNETVKEIHSYNLENIVKFYGPSKQMNLIYGLSDIVISSSTDPEAFGRISIEAQAMGKYIIASNHGGSQETVIEGKTGSLYSPLSHKELSATILDVIKNLKYKSDSVFDSAIDNVAKNYTKESMCKNTLNFYEEILNY
tara:strand:+ start:4069 stop:5211 length:1143 start_codon:yes stop_codon:yes gene_type:complete